jgi:type IX secretion system PorP/SprF family membrane protein
MKNPGWKIFIISLLLIFHWGISTCHGQQRQFYSQYMYNHLAINPAYAGNQKMLSATLIYRKQWVGLQGAPNTQTASIHNGDRKKKIGYGLLISRDEIGVHKDYSIYGCYAYKIKFGKGTVALGVQGGVNYLTSNYTGLNADPTYDPLLPRNTAVWNPNVGTGIFYSSKKAYAGFSIPYLINNRVINKKDISTTTSGTEERYYFITGGIVLPLTEHTKIKPSTLIRLQENAPVGFDLNANLIFHEIVSVGGSYRTGRSFVFLSQVVLSNHFMMGYAYDYAFSALNGYTKGSHEIMLNYRIDLNPERCHTYW